MLLLLGMAISSLMACSTGQDSIRLPQVNPSARGDPKLDSQLNQLISVQGSGNFSSFALQHNIELLDGKVRVIIETEPGQLRAAEQAITEAGGIVETSYNDLLQAVVPVVNLTSLAGSPAVRFIRLPLQALPGS